MKLPKGTHKIIAEKYSVSPCTVKKNFDKKCLTMGEEKIFSRRFARNVPIVDLSVFIVNSSTIFCAILHYVKGGL